MRIDNDLLTQLRAVRDARNVNSVFPTLVSGDALKNARRGVWDTIRARYSLPTDVKFKVELDGPDAGELRRKDTSEAYTPPAPNSGAQCSVDPAGGSTRYVVIDDDANDEIVFSNLADVFAYVRDNSSIRVVTV